MYNYMDNHVELKQISRSALLHFINLVEDSKLNKPVRFSIICATFACTDCRVKMAKKMVENCEEKEYKYLIRY